MLKILSLILKLNEPLTVNENSQGRSSKLPFSPPQKRKEKHIANFGIVSQKSNYCNPKSLTPCMMSVDGTMGGAGHVMELTWHIWVR